VSDVETYSDSENEDAERISLVSSASSSDDKSEEAKKIRPRNLNFTFRKSDMPIKRLHWSAEGNDFGSTALTPLDFFKHFLRMIW
jgi:hypothetical protein